MKVFRSALICGQKRSHSAHDHDSDIVGCWSALRELRNRGVDRFYNLDLIACRTAIIMIGLTGGLIWNTVTS